MNLTNCPVCDQKTAEFTFFEGKGNDRTSPIECEQCGRFSVSGEFSRTSLPIEYQQRHIVAGAIRELNERGIEPLIDTLEGLLTQVSVPKNPLEIMDRFLLLIAARSSRADELVRFKETDFALAYCHDQGEWTWVLRQMAELGYIEPWGGDYSFRIHPRGYQRLTELSSAQKRFDQAFVAMSFDKSLTPVFTHGFKPAIEQAGYDAFRIDKSEHNNRIDDQIIAEIRRSGLMVADFTGQRNGVYFEAGLALGLGIPVIWTCNVTDKDSLHFDTRQFNHILWTDADDLREQLENRIRATAPSPKANF